MIEARWLSSQDDLSEITKVHEACSIIMPSGDVMFICLFDAKTTKLIGVGSARFLEINTRFMIESLCVLPDYRKQGYGDFLLRLLIRRIFDAGFSQYIHVNEEVSPFFVKRGFTIKSNESGRLLLVREGDVFPCK